MLEMGPSVFYSKHHKIYPYRRNIFTVDYNRYLGNSEIFVVLDFYVYIAFFLFSLCSHLTKNTNCLDYEEQSRKRY
jgi:hypothetical protein